MGFLPGFLPGFQVGVPKKTAGFFGYVPGHPNPGDISASC